MCKLTVHTLVRRYGVGLEGGTFHGGFEWATILPNSGSQSQTNIGPKTISINVQNNIKLYDKSLNWEKVIKDLS